MLLNKKGISSGMIFFIVSLIIAGIILFCIPSFFSETSIDDEVNDLYNKDNKMNDDLFRILISSENRDIDEYITNYSNQKGYHVDISHADTLDIIDSLNHGAQYDAVWLSNSMWTYKLDKNKTTLSNSKSIYITPVIFGIKKSKAEELGFVGRDVYTQEIVDSIKNGKLKFSMSNPLTTNSGASAYFALLYTLAGNPVSITEDVLKDENLKENLKTFFTGLERTSGTEDYLQQMFLNGDFEAVVTYESSIININQKLIKENKEPLYAIYPVDGVAICDNVFAYVDKGVSKKKDIFLDIQSYLLSDNSRKVLADSGRRTWYGGITNKANTSVFNSDWGIDTTKYINSVKFPNLEVIKLALSVYQEQLRKPVYVAFCLDYSGSMRGERIDNLIEALELVLSEDSTEYDIHFSSKDKVEIIPFAYSAITFDPKWNSSNYTYDELVDNCMGITPYGDTAAYDGLEASIEALLEDRSIIDKYNASIILMTDGEINVGSFDSFKEYYTSKNIKIPIYSIMFGDAKMDELREIAKLTNGKVFDGKGNLVEAFKEVRGYN